MKAIALILALILAAPAWALQHSPKATVLAGTVLYVVDGDTLDFGAPGEKTIRVRLSEIDAPELRQNHGTGMGKAIGLSSRGNAFPRFLASRAMTGALGAELDSKFQNPLKFQWSSGGAPLTLNGYDATLLIDLCKAILNASVRGKLKANQTGIAQQAAMRSRESKDWFTRPNNGKTPTRARLLQVRHGAKLRDHHVPQLRAMPRALCHADRHQRRRVALVRLPIDVRSVRPVTIFSARLGKGF